MKHELPDRDWHGSHHPWAYRANCFRWFDTDIVGVNFLPLATEMRAWLEGRGVLSLPPEQGEGNRGSYYNPYTYSGAALGAILSRLVNSFATYVDSNSDDHNEVDAEIERLRIYNEILLYTARFCETAIKQLLYCTAIPERDFNRMALGALLESPCPSCKKAKGEQSHSISLVGTLAHPFHLCLEFEHCALDHMALVNSLRNSQAAHSDMQMLKVRTVEASKNQLREECDDILSKFVHLLSHLESLEQRMLEDLIQKGRAIMVLKLGGLAPEDCNFNLVPGQPFIESPKNLSKTSQI